MTAPGIASVAVRSERPVRSVPALSRRQFEVLELLSTGRTIDDAAYRLGRSYSAIHMRLDGIYRRLGTGGLVETYHELGWLTVPSGAELRSAA